MRGRARSWVIAALLTLGCDGGGVTLAIDLRTDLTPGAEFDGVEVSVDGVGREDTFPRAEQDFSRGVRVAELTGLSPDTYRATVTLFLRGVPVLTRPVVAQVENTIALTVIVTRECRNVSCPDASDAAATACLGGRCVEPTCTPETPELCPSEGGCVSDAQCSAAAPCASARCQNGVCFVEDDGTCGASEFCDVSAGGCAARPDVDAGVAPTDAGVDAVCSPGAPSITIVEPEGSERFTPTESPLTIRWRATGVSGDVRVRVFDGAMVQVDDVVPVCDGEHTTTQLYDCGCTLEVSSVDDPSVIDSKPFGITTD